MIVDQLSLQKQLLSAEMMEERRDILSRYSGVQEFVEAHPSLKTFLAGLNSECAVALYAVIACGQGARIFGKIEHLPDKFERLRQLLQTLIAVEHFYEPLGGIVGYHLTILQLLKEKTAEKPDHLHYHKPEGVDISDETPEVKQAIQWGIEALPEMAEMYPVGGAGDRLNLRDEKTGEPLAVAQLLFEGRPLIESLLRDVQAKEYLYYKLFEKQLNTPIALMTSHEKHNHARITTLFEEKKWFGRKKNDFFFFTQPLVPVVTEKGEWVLKGPLELLLKPGGHGVIWKLAQNCGVFRWFEKKGRSKLLIRQINNPLAATDYGLLAFTGVGVKKNKKFGFASCYRLLNTAEGMDALIEEKTEKGSLYHIGNIEYTDFKKHGIEDIPEVPGSPYSAFPANTNILFADLKAVQEALRTHPLPGMLVNMKTEVEKEKAGRLESAMQNISAAFVDTSVSEDMQTYLTFNDRTKTISVTKKAYTSSQSFVETPEGAFYDHLKNYEQHLREDCHIALPAIGEEEDYLEEGPPFLVALHPALGPLYSVIAQKLRGGTFARRAELVLDIAEVDIQNLTLEGSLLVVATNPMGAFDAEGVLRYGEACGKCHLQNVTVKNQGIDYSLQNCFWKSEVQRKEAVEICIEEDGEFFAKDVVFEGPHRIEVRAGERVVAYMKEGNVHFRTEKIKAPTWSWSYAFCEDGTITLKKVCLA